jgi:hypothetical protein
MTEGDTENNRPSQKRDKSIHGQGITEQNGTKKLTNTEETGK